MKTEILSAAESSFAIETACEFFKKGETVALPSETVYGLAANAFDAKAVARIFEAKERPLSDPLIVHIADPESLSQVAVGGLPDFLKKLTRSFWPGPLTLVLPRHPDLPDLVTAGQETVAVRCPAHPVFRRVLRACRFPLAAPSANRFGRISPTRATDVFAELQGRIPLILDGGACERGLESTIVLPIQVGGDAKKFALQILRPGPVTAEELADFAPIFIPEKTTAAPVTPGSLASHYAPRTPLHLLSEGEPPASWKCRGLIAWDEKTSAAQDYVATEYLSRGLDLHEAATNLYYAMRSLDQLQLDGICVEPLPETGIGRAIMDRLRRASFHG